MIQNLWLKFVSVFYPWRIDDSFMKNWWFIHWSGTQWEWTVYNNKFDFLSVRLDMVNILKQLMFTLIVNLFASPITEIGNSFFSSFSILRSLFPLFYVSLYFLQIFFIIVVSSPSSFIRFLPQHSDFLHQGMTILRKYLYVRTNCVRDSATRSFDSDQSAKRARLSSGSMIRAAQLARHAV